MQWVFWVTSVAPVVMGLSLSEGIIAVSAIVTAAATATLAIFTFLIVGTERTRHAESRQSVHDAIAVHASLLKRSIDKSLEREWPEDGWTLEYMQKWTYRFQRGYPYLQPRADEIAIKASQASKEVANAAAHKKCRYWIRRLKALVVSAEGSFFGRYPSGAALLASGPSTLLISSS